MKVLLLAPPNDGHALRVAHELEQLQINTEFLLFQQLLHNSHIKLAYRSDGANLAFTTADGKHIELDQYGSIWYRRPGTIPAQRFDQIWVQQFVDQETNHTLFGALNAIPSLWVNHPAKDQQCLLKLQQLRVAASCGLKVPDTLVTNDPVEVMQFYEDCEQQVVYKVISENSSQLIPLYEMPAGIPTLPLREFDFQYLEQVKFGPHLFQRRIKKSYDVRTTIIGKKIFSIRIDSQEGKGKLDWRQDYSVPMTECQLPDDVAQACLLLMQRFGLNYGALDFCVTPEGEFYFLEINCAGQYLWIEQRTGMPISRELAKLLAGKAEPLVDTRTLTHPVVIPHQFATTLISPNR